MTHRATRLQGRRSPWLAGAAVVVILAVVILFAISQDSGSPQAAITSTTATGVGDTTTAAIGFGSTTSPPVASSTSSVPEISENPIPQNGDEAETCEAIRERLQEYRDAAVASPTLALLDLSGQLEEFENQIDFLGKGSDWSISILEQIFQVRRDWITAASAAESEDQQVADERRASALALLDQAISVECPAP